MIAANKRLLKATLTQGVLGIQITLIELYTANIESVGIEASLVANFAFSAVTMMDGTSTLTHYVLAFFYYIPFIICFIVALIVVAQVLFCPW